MTSKRVLLLVVQWCERQDFCGVVFHQNPVNGSSKTVDIGISEAVNDCLIMFCIGESKGLL